MNEKYVSIGMAVIILGMTMFWIGWHNADLAQNYFRIYTFYNLDYELCSDCGLAGCISCDNVYMQGMYLLIQGLSATLLGGVIMGAGFGKEER